MSGCIGIMKRTYNFGVIGGGDSIRTYMPTH